MISLEPNYLKDVKAISMLLFQWWKRAYILPLSSSGSSPKKTGGYALVNDRPNFANI